jgi:hypothetical protein
VETPAGAESTLPRVNRLSLRSDQPAEPAPAQAPAVAGQRPIEYRLRRASVVGVGAEGAPAQPGTGDGGGPVRLVCTGEGGQFWLAHVHTAGSRADSDSEAGGAGVAAEGRSGAAARQRGGAAQRTQES